MRVGVSPERLAATIGVGAACALFPLLGATTALTLVAGLALRMNQIVLHAINQLLGPVQLVMILLYLRAGEWIWHVRGERFSVADMIRDFHRTGMLDFLRTFGWAGVHAVTAWAVSAPFIVCALSLLARRPLRRLAGTTAYP